MIALEKWQTSTKRKAIEKLFISSLVFMGASTTYTTQAFAATLSAIPNVTSRSVAVFPLPVATDITFSVNVPAVDGLPPDIRLTDFTAQLFDNLTTLDRASFSWSAAPGWIVSSQDNLAGNAYFQALSYNTGISPGGTLGGFQVSGVGIDLALTGNVRITDVSTSVPEPLTIFGTATAALGYGALLKRKYSKNTES